MAEGKETPAMRQYAAFKRRYPDCLLLFRMGDFYEMFHDDAVAAHKALGLTLTQRTEGVPMAGVPYHALDGYLKRFLQAGFRVAVCEQVQDPKQATGVVDRAVSRVMTPGTLVDEGLLESDATSTLAAAAFLDSGDDPAGRVGLAIVEVSTGAFTVLQCRAGEVGDELARRSVTELLYASAGETSAAQAPARVKRVLDATGIAGTPRPAWHFRPQEALEALLGQYRVATLAGFGLRDDDPVVLAAGAIVRYLRETQTGDAESVSQSAGATLTAALLRQRSLDYLQPPRGEDHRDFLVIDNVSLRALEIERTIRGAQAEGSLVGVFTRGNGASRACCTSMGKRLVRDWLCRPACSLDVIRARHDAVEALLNDRSRAETLGRALERIQDVARLAARATLGRAGPRDVVALGRSLGTIDDLIRAASGCAALSRLGDELLAVRGAVLPLSQEVARVCVDDAPAHLREGGLVRDGVDAELDEARLLQRESGAFLAQYQERLTREFDLPSLKVGYTKVFGYFIELPSAQARRAPALFIRRQTLKNAERYITPELKQYEDKVLTAEERALSREQALFLALCAQAASCAGACARFAGAAAELDALRCFAMIAAARRWTRPRMTEAPVLRIVQGRHPVLETMIEGGFVPNDCALGAGGEDQSGAAPQAAPGLALITGPNMAGKSTYIRQVALIVILAHAGAFVPAANATIGLTDRVFTRIGADDALHAGQSTFMVEMLETANILHHATERSLVVLDEIGRGTSTLDGLSLAWAICERLAGGAPGDSSGGTGVPPVELDVTRHGPRTLFATHYHELTDLEERLPGRVANLRVTVHEKGDEVVFLHRIVPGRASRSYGIQVARLAGLPRSVVERAAALLEQLAVHHAPGDGDAEGSCGPREPGLRLVGAEAGEPAPRAEVKPLHSLRRDVGRAADGATAQRAPMGQMGLFREFVPHPVVDRLRAIDLQRMTPMEAFDELRRLAEEAAREP